MLSFVDEKDWAAMLGASAWPPASPLRALGDEDDEVDSEDFFDDEEDDRDDLDDEDLDEDFDDEFDLDDDDDDDLDVDEDDDG